MKVSILKDGINYEANLSVPKSIGIPIMPGKSNPRCFYAEDPIAEPMIIGDFVGSVLAGSPVNFFKTTITPHGNGTHTECVGHISSNMESIRDALTNYHFLAEVVSIPLVRDGDDMVISRDELIKAIQYDVEALIIRTLPNSGEKKYKDYSGTNPPYIRKDAMEFILEKGYQHLLLDLPSVDREQDDGELISHKLFWNFPDKKETTKTITELIFVEDSIADGLYLLNLQIANMNLDAVISHPVLYQLEKVK